MPSPADLPDPGMTPASPALRVDSLPTELSEKSPTKPMEASLINCVFFLVQYSCETGSMDKLDYLE